MRDKSKFIAFLLSIIPGLAHLYIGLKERAMIFFIMFAGITVGSVSLAAIGGNDRFLIIFAFGYPLIWLVAIIDMFSTWKKIEKREMFIGEVINETNFDAKLDKKTIALGLSIIPGAGHMYLGYQNKGLALMGTFFFSVFFMGWLGISIFLFTLPLIWFYSFFDCMHILDGNEEALDKTFVIPNIKPEWIGFGLIAIGIFIVLEKILFPLIVPQIRRYVQTSIVSFIFIVIGIRILIRNKRIDNNIKNNIIEIRGEEDED